MVVVKGIGNIEKNIYEETQVEWKINSFFSLIENDEFNYNSPTFPFKETSWFFQLKPTSVIMLFLGKERECEYSVNYNFGLKKLDGSVIQLTTNIVEGSRKDSDANRLISLSELQNQKHELVPSNVLTITCTLKSGTPHLTQLTELKELKLINLNGLSQNFKDLFADQESCDTTLRVKEKEFKAHRSVLIARSSVFRALFQNDMAEKQSGIITIPDCDADSFEEFLKYVYSGQLEGMSFSSAFHLYSTSDKYDVQDLKSFCVQVLMQSLAVENVLSVVTMADKYDDAKLMSAAQDYFNRNMGEIFDTPEWISFVKNNIRLMQKVLKGMSSQVKFF